MSGGGFHEKGDASGDFLEEFFGLLGDFLDADLFALLHVGTHVADDEGDAEGSATRELAGEGFARHRGFFGFGCAEVDEVAVVGDQSLGAQSGFGDGFSEFLRGVFGERFGLPLLGGGSEDLDSVAPNGFAPADGIGESFSSGHVGADEGCGHFRILARLGAFF